MTSFWGKSLAGAAALLLSGLAATSGHADTASFSLPPELQAKVDSHPHVKKITDWGSRAEWSADSKKLLLVSREFGDLFELDVASGKTKPLTFHYPHDGILRAYYLQDGNILMMAQRDHTPGAERYGRFFGSELWILKSDLSGPAIALDEPNVEGVAVSRSSMKISWARMEGPKPPVTLDADLEKVGRNYQRNGQIMIGDIQMNGGKPVVANKRVVLDCGAATGTIATLLAKTGSKCLLIEPQNFVPQSDEKLTFSMVSYNSKAKRSEISAYVLDLKTNKVVRLGADPSYAEAEGVFPDGKSTLVEYTTEPDLSKATSIIDLWQFPIDGRGAPKRVTHYHELDPQLKSNQGVISPDGRWMAFGVSTDEIEKKVAGQGIGIFLMDLKAAGF